ncbi:two-component sensor histidine kinase [Devosia pacifica]|uniref:histidine kinase n=1 Tax=Devosia pacifica TaxID=1335967 RepID=A0A918SAD5_9HYPH|nr:ATP-binding protein [Devosia pacifica]GHA31573.1 two-component sensor histidine kinase [Devosia pacifica]
MDSRQRWQSVVTRTSLILLVSGLVFAGLLIVGELSPVWAIAGFAGIAAVTLLTAREGADAELASEALPIRSGGMDDVFAFADALNEPCLLLGRSGRVIHRNHAAARQYPSVQAGNPISFSMRNPDLLRAVDAVFATARPQMVELHETLPSESWHRVLITPLHLPEHEWFEDPQRMLVITFSSLTELKRVDAMRSDFIANASHELRTPLASLLGFIETLQGPAARDAAARVKFLDIMQSQARRMSNLVDDLLSLSRIEMYQHVRPTGCVDLAVLLAEVREGLQVRAEEAGIVLGLEVPAGTHKVTADREQLYEVFENLVDNAIKYGASGKRVDMILRPSNRQNYAYTASVIDYGPGVPEDQVPRLTERFYRLDVEASRRKKSTGLGLAIVKHIVQRHRGLMTIKSRPGEGLRIDVQLPG